jgi:hypothetical protein
MKIIKKKKKEEIVKSDQSQNLTLETLNIGLSASILFDRDLSQRVAPEHPYKQSIATHCIIKGIEWNDIPLIRKGIESGGNVNYANPTKDNLNFIQIACKEKNYYIVTELLKSPTINIKAYKKNTDPALHLVVKKETAEWKDREIINLLIKHDPTVIHIKNDNGKRVIDLVCDVYNVLYNQYVAIKLPDRTLYENLSKQEYLMYTLLSATSPYTECVLFKAMLEQKDSTGVQLPKELITHIIFYYYALNIETIVAKKQYAHYYGIYYALLIEQKIAIKRQLLEKPEAALLWSSL